MEREKDLFLRKKKERKKERKKKERKKEKQKGKLRLKICFSLQVDGGKSRILFRRRSR